jgi:hypothetical protein
MQALRYKGFTSSQAIASVDRDMFTAGLAGAVDEAEAQEIHARATRVHAAAAILITDFRTAAHFDVPWLPSATAADGTPPPIPNWEELFGSADYATFDPTRSVYSEGAYLADLLYYLRRLGGAGGTGDDDGPVGNPLKARRPDLWQVQLSADNTNLTLPVVDLVNELLESTVDPDTAIPAAQRQSSGDSATLRIQPQHVNTGAYDKLRTAVYPWDLPFDLWREQTDAYLGNLGVSRASLLETFGAAADSPTLLDDERLGLSSVTAQIIVGEAVTPTRTLADYYGRPASADLVHDMSTVRTLLDTGSMHYTDLIQLLDTRFVNPGGPLSIVVDADSPYDTTKMTVQGLDPAALDRLHRFVRLQRALGWSAADLDRAIDGGNNQGRLDRTTLRAVAAVKRPVEPAQPARRAGAGVLQRDRDPRLRRRPAAAAVRPSAGCLSPAATATWKPSPTRPRPSPRDAERLARRQPPQPTVLKAQQTFFSAYSK